MSKSSKKILSIMQNHQTIQKQNSSRPYRQLSHKNLTSLKNTRSISSFGKKQRDSPQKVNSSMRIISATRNLENPLQTIINVICEQSKVSSDQDIIRDISNRIDRCLDIAGEYKEQKIEKVLEYFKVYIGKMLLRIMQCQKSRFNSCVDKVYKLAYDYEKQIQDARKKQQFEFKQILLKHEGQLGRKLQQRNIRAVFNSQIHNEMQSTGGLNLQLWIKGSDVMKNYIQQLEYNREKFLQQLEIGRFQSDSNVNYDRKNLLGAQSIK